MEAVRTASLSSSSSSLPFALRIICGKLRKLCCSTVAAILCKLLYVFLIFFFALSGAAMGAMVGVFLGLRANIGFFYGFIVGAINGSIFGIRLLSLFLAIFQYDDGEKGIECFFSLISTTASILSGRLIRDWFKVHLT